MYGLDSNPEGCMEPRPLILLVSTEAGTTQLDETIGHSITKVIVGQLEIEKR